MLNNIKKLLLNSLVKSKFNFLIYIPGLIYSILIAFLLLTSSENITGFWLFKIPYFDKFAHFVLFGVLYFIWFVTFSISTVNNRKETYKKVIIIAIASISYSIILETAQYFIPYRHFNAYDIVADVIGIIFATFLSYIYNIRK